MWLSTIIIAVRVWVELSSQWESSYGQITSQLARHFTRVGLGAIAFLDTLWVGVGSVGGWSSGSGLGLLQIGFLGRNVGYGLIRKSEHSQ